jgi:hypothetical protein
MQGPEDDAVRAVWHAAGVHSRDVREGILKYNFEYTKFPRVNPQTNLEHNEDHLKAVREDTAIRLARRISDPAGIRIKYNHAMKYIHFDQAIEVTPDTDFLDMATMFSDTTSVEAEYKRYCDKNAVPLGDALAQVTKSAQLLALTYKMAGASTSTDRERFVRWMQHFARGQHPRQEESDLVRMMRQMQVAAGAVQPVIPMAAFLPPAAAEQTPPIPFTDPGEDAVPRFVDRIDEFKLYPACLTPASQGI